MPPLLLLVVPAAGALVGRMWYFPSVSTVMVEAEGRNVVVPLFERVASSAVSPSICWVTVAAAVQVMVYQVPGIAFSVLVMMI